MEQFKENSSHCILKRSGYCKEKRNCHNHSKNWKEKVYLQSHSKGQKEASTCNNTSTNRDSKCNKNTNSNSNSFSGYPRFLQEWKWCVNPARNHSGAETKGSCCKWGFGWYRSVYMERRQTCRSELAGIKCTWQIRCERIDGIGKIELLLEPVKQSGCEQEYGIGILVLRW